MLLGDGGWWLAVVRCAGPGGAYQGWKCDGGKTSYYHWSASAEVLFRYLDKIVVNCPPRSILQSCDGFGDYVLMRPSKAE